ncbi:MAG: hypothetical protein JHC89_09970 [Acetobacteraceae bacterium]|nr:hypothetical protein [Acetobacteraceae bacterium]
MDTMEQRRVDLHPNLAAVYRAKIERLQEAMAGEGGRVILETLRELIEHVTVSAAPVTGGEPRIELVGHLTALFRAGGAEGLPVFGHAKSPLAVANGLARAAPARLRPVMLRIRRMWLGYHQLECQDHTTVANGNISGGHVNNQASVLLPRPAFASRVPDRKNPLDR